MPDDTNTGESADKSPEPVRIMDKVDYVYTSFAQFAASNLDFRIAFGDRLPPEGKVKPLLGIVMSHDQARSFLRALTANLKALDDALHPSIPVQTNSGGAES